MLHSEIVEGHFSIWNMALLGLNWLGRKSNATSAALAPNIACHKCLAQKSNLWHMCNQGILPLDYWDG